MAGTSVALTLDEAAALLSPPLSPGQLREIIRALRWEPAGRRHTGHAGRPEYTWDWEQIIRLHEALLPWLG
jgi:hypothetical protein